MALRLRARIAAFLNPPEERRGFDIFKLGDPETTWIPNREAMEQFAACLEDVGYTGDAIIWNYAISCQRVDGEARLIVGDADLTVTDNDIETLQRFVDEHMDVPCRVLRFEG